MVKDLGRELMIYDPENDSAHILNLTAAAIFRLCDGKHSFEDIDQAIRTQFVAKETHNIHRDIYKFIVELKRRGFLKIFF
jgi:hypothetical protein